MRGNLTDPYNSAITLRYIGIQSLRDRIIDQDGHLLLEKLNQPLFLHNRGINLGGFLVEEGNDAVLLVFGRQGNRDLFEILVVHIPLPDSNAIRQRVVNTDQR
ncbi:hypothetical protein D3C84_872620 [compost metagenome]